ncbi:uncharacterized protein A1O9_12040 [Exophiala aquamarina CBS 119918]|uniref:BZIP domain-containing protein n=1 Tax=Exophiala aquamarina CBS 119918 TaxID=1182545 RepID=A0A072P8Y0_9EURO|nr:uncharacterized protein A1O9_12040 [Exophiala aquamarina CBS 119918]KEF52050.1 hypothetical protein A1O9_12040 [Exophiala aquamarina CBS 119918]
MANKLSTSSEQNKKKLRNRLSQRAYRRRQAECVRDLKHRTSADESNAEQIEALQTENRALRRELVDVQNKLYSVSATIQMLTDSMSQTLDGIPVVKHTPEEDERQTGVSDRVGQTARVQISSSSPEDLLTLVPDVCEPVLLDELSRPLYSTALAEENNESFPTFMNRTTASLQNAWGGPEALEGTMAPEVGLANAQPLSYVQIPNIWSFDYQMGPQSYANALASGTGWNALANSVWKQSNSSFSDHVQVIRLLLKKELDASWFQSTRPQQQKRAESKDMLIADVTSLYQPVLMALSMFNSVARPSAMTWYAKTRFYHIANLTAWQVDPSPDTFQKLHENYRPTQIQSRNQYPCVVDWIPFPSVRDRIIRLHAANPHIDQIFCDAVSSYVVEARMSDLILGAPPVKVYIRVTDLIPAMSGADETSADADLESLLPAPDIPSLFSSPRAARAAFWFLHMDRGISLYKMDPTFFDRYPELYDTSCNISATGFALKPDIQTILTYPQPLDAPTIAVYRGFLNFTIGGWYPPTPTRW